MEGAVPGEPEGSSGAVPRPRRPRRRWARLGLGLVVVGALLIGAAAWVVVRRPVWILRPILTAAGGDIPIDLESARWVSASELEVTGFSMGGSNRVGSASIGFDYREFIGREPGHERGDSETLRLKDIVVGGLGSIGSADLQADLGLVVAAGLNRDSGGVGNAPSPAELVLSDLAMGPSGRVDSIRFRFDLGGAIALAMGSSNAPVAGTARMADVNLTGLSMLPTGRVEAVRAQVDLAKVIAAVTRPGGVPAARAETNLTEVIVSGVSLGPAGYVDSVRARFDPAGIVRALMDATKTGGQPELVIEEISIDRPHLSITREEILEHQQRSAARETPKPGGPLVEIRRVQVSEGLVQVKNLAPGLPPLPIPIDQVVSNVVFGAGRDHPSAAKPLTIHIRDWTLRSPYDPLATVLRLQSIAISFSVRGLLENRLESIEFVEPTIFLGQDLFWFSDLLQKEAARLPAGKPWTVGDFGIRGGRVIVATQGETELELPLVFAAQQREMQVGTLQDMHLSAEIEVVPVSLDYRERYGIAVDNLRGKLEFALPRGKAGANNVVNTLKADRIAWKDLSSSNTWVSVTFDVNGVYGQFGGEGYGGYVNGDATLMFKETREWVAAVAATGVDLGGAVGDVVPEHVRLTGRGSGTVVVRGRERIIRECTGKFGLLDKGRLEIVALDELLGRIPADWDVTKKDLAGIVLNAFRTYHYTSGEADFSYKPPLSYLRAHFRGTEGKRDIDVSYKHDLEKQPN